MENGTAVVSAPVVPDVSALKLKGKTALITGSSSGIGKAVALRFAAEGADVALNYPPGDTKGKDQCDAIAEAIRKVGRTCVIAPADVSSVEDVEKMVGVVVSELGRIDILVNNAGIAAGGGPVTEITPEAWDKLFSVNVRGTFLVTQAVVPLMKKEGYGRIVNSASQLAYKGATGFAHYCASKGAIISFTRAVALELATTDIRINSVAPGATMTPILEGLDQSMLDGIKAQIPRGQIAEVEDITPSYVFLASEEAKHMVGQTVSPNGGDVML